MAWYRTTPSTLLDRFATNCRALELARDRLDRFPNDPETRDHYFALSDEHDDLSERIDELREAPGY